MVSKKVLIVVKPVKQWFILVRIPAIGTHYQRMLCKKRTLLRNVPYLLVSSLF